MVSANLDAITQESHPERLSATFKLPLQRTPRAGIAVNNGAGDRAWLEEIRIEYQLQLARCFRLGLPALRLEELGVGHCLPIERLADVLALAPALKPIAKPSDSTPIAMSPASPRKPAGGKPKSMSQSVRAAPTTEATHTKPI